MKDIPKLDIIKKHRIRKASIYLLIILVIFFTSWFFISKFYDTYKVIFQNPVLMVVRPPILIVQRFFLSPIPKATLIDVNPLTKPSDIDKTIKANGTFDYVQTGSINPVSKEVIRTLVHNKVVQKYGEDVWNEMDYIITHESDYDPYIVNKTSGACGIFQALPCSKIPSLDITDQIYWGLNVYIPQHYGGSINAAYNQKKKVGWY